MEQHEQGTDVVSSCKGHQDYVGLSFSIDYLLFNKRSDDTTGDVRTQSPTSAVVLYSNAQKQSVSSPADPDSLKMEGAEGNSGGSSESFKVDKGKDEKGFWTGSTGNPQDKPAQSYIALISMAILASEEKKLLLCDIYQWIMDHYPYFKSKDKNWKNSVRHNLSLNECFIKAGRSDNGKGHFWAIHPANVHDFSKGDYHHRRARRRIRRAMSRVPYLLPSFFPVRHVRSSPCWCCCPGNQPAFHPGSMYWAWATLPVRYTPPRPFP